MKLEFLKDRRVICFAAGAAVALFGKKILNSEKTRKFCVNGIAKGMKLSSDAKETFKNMKDEAEDICYEAKSTLEKEDAVTDEI